MRNANKTWTRKVEEKKDHSEDTGVGLQYNNIPKEI